MREEYTLKEFVEEVSAKSPLNGISLLSKLVELEATENWLNAMYGIRLEIKVKPTEKVEGRFYGKGLIEKLKFK